MESEGTEEEVKNEAGGLERVYQENIKPIIDSVSSFLPSLSLSQFKFNGSPKKKESIVDSISTPKKKESVVDSIKPQKDYYSTVRILESGGRNRARASTSSAYGPFQFIESTWNAYTKKLGKDYSLEDRSDYAKSLEIMRAFTEDNRARMVKRLKRPVSDVELYMGHFLGPSGAIKLLNANDNVDASKLLVREANSNKSLFFKRGSNKARTVGELKEEITRKYMRAANGEKR